MRTLPHFVCADTSATARCLQAAGIAVFILSWSPPASARTWFVEKDGSGDFTVIQDAIDAASSGDVVRIGPGRFEEHRIVTGINGGVDDVHFYSRHALLTIEGSGVGVTIVGPTTHASSRDGFWPDVSTEHLVLQDLTLENVDEGIVAGAQNIDIRKCEFRNMRFGICSVVSYTIAIANSSFVDCSDRAIVLFDLPFGTPQSSVIVDSHFQGSSTAIVSQLGANQISGCTIERVRVGIGFQAFAIGTVSNTTITDYEISGIDIRGGASVTAADCVIGVGPANLYLAGGSLAGERLTLAGGTLYTINANSGSPVRLTDSHILNAGGWSFQAVGLDPIRTFDLRNNWWGTTDAAQIESWIDSGLHTVLFEPFHGMPVRTEASSFGELKARFAPD